VRRTFLAITLLSCALAVSQPSNYARVERDNVRPAAEQGKQDETKPAATQAPQENKEKTKPAATSGQFGNVEAITAAQLKEWLYVVASDEMEGRATPSRGLDLTAKFIAERLSRWGVKPGGDDRTYFQKFELTGRRLDPEMTIASVNGQSFKLGEDFVAELTPGQWSGRVVYVGHGYVIRSKDIDAYRGIDVKGKIMLAVKRFPEGVPFEDIRGKKAGEDYHTPETYGRANGARGVIYILNPWAFMNWLNGHGLSLNPQRNRLKRLHGEGADIPVICASGKMAGAILFGEKIDERTLRIQANMGEVPKAFELSAGKQVSINIALKIDKATTQNVVGVIEGADPILKKEYVVVGAHYDHVGMNQNADGDRIFNGADDDGSGTVATMAIAQALAKTRTRPKRSILFVWHAGEENGLWGSEFFTNNPTVPIGRIVAQLNIDMIGRSKKEGDNNPANMDLTGPNELYVIGPKMMSADLGNLNEEVNNSYLKLAFNYKYDDPADGKRIFYRSDHYNYAKKGIPIIFYFSGVHEDYHGPGDTADKIDYQKLEKVTRTVFATMWRLANAHTRPKVDKPLPPQATN
jgi:Peptidase family M28